MHDFVLRVQEEEKKILLEKVCTGYMGAADFLYYC